MNKSNDAILPPGWVRQCLDRILQDCGYASYNELADEIGESGANVNAWMTRNSPYGRTGAPMLHDKTGANINWLMARSDDAFPDGPKINPALKTARVYGSLNEIRKQILEFARALAVTNKELAVAWKERLEAAEPAEYQEKAFRGLLLGLLEFSAGSGASSNRSAQVEQAPARRGQGKRK